MTTYLQIRSRLSALRRSGAGGFSLPELLVAISILGALGGITAVAFGGFNSASSSISCKSDTTRLKRAESSFFLQQARYGSGAELVSAGLLGAPSDLHDVTVASSAYTISEVGRCIGTSTAYNIPAPTVGTTDQSGVTVAVMNADGTAVSGAVVSYSQGSWTTLGTTGSSGQVNGPLADGTYDFRVVLGGTTNTLSAVSVKQGTLVTFPTVKLSVTLANSSGAPVSGGSVSVRSSGGSSSSIGSTGGSGSVSAQVLPAIYDVTMTYSGHVMTQSGIVVNAPTTVPFTTHTLTVKLLSAAGAPLSGGAVSATPQGGSAFSLGNTNASGIVTASVLDGAYTISMTYNSQTVTQTPTLSGDTTVTFQLTSVALQMHSSTGSGLMGQDSAIWWRNAGGSSWNFAGYPDGSGNVSLLMLPGNYDFEARWFGVYEVKSAVAISAGSTVTWQSVLATEFMRSSTGSGLTGQDSAIWVRPAGSASWTFSGYPNGSGQVAQQLLASTYDFEARWFGVYNVQSSVTISSATTVTFQSVLATEFMRSSTGSGLTGQDSAIWVRPAGSASWTFSGYPNGSGQVAQELFASTYDFEARWFGVYGVQSSIAISSATTVTWQAEAVTEFMRASTGSGLTGQDSAIWVRPAGAGSWTFSGYPNGSGQVVQQLLDATYDFEARWFGIYNVQSSVAVSSATTVTFQSMLATEFMRSSTGSGLTGQDSAIWVRPAGAGSWTFSGYPNGSGQVAQELFASSYDFEARWFGLYGVQSSLTISSATTVTFQGEAVTLSMLSSTGSGLTGQDSAIWVRPAGSASWIFSGYPNGSGQVAQQLLDGSYDVEYRWLGVMQVSSANVVNSATTIGVSAAALTVTARKASDNSLVTGANTYVITGGGTFFLGTTDGSGQYVAQVLVGTVGAKCTKAALTGTNSNLVVGSGGASTTVLLA